jgi:hypothetical protein
LVEVLYRGGWQLYLTNVLDPETWRFSNAGVKRKRQSHRSPVLNL